MNESNEAMDAIFGDDEVREVLRESFYSEPVSFSGAERSPHPARSESARGPTPATLTPLANPAPVRGPKKRKRAKKKPDHYEVICISLYKEDLARLDAMVKDLKESGHRKMSRSALIRFALDTADTDALPRSY